MTTTPADPRALRAPYGKSPSIRPALVVLACAAAVTLGGVAVALVGSGQTTAPTVSGLGVAVPGVNLTAIGAAPVLRRIATDGSPPKDVVDALVVPNGARIVGTSTPDAGIDLYDRSISFQLGTSSSELLSFYDVELKRAHWSQVAEYPGSGASKEILAHRNGSDGYEWEVGVVVTPVNPAISPALAGDGQTSPTVGLTLRLFQIPDDGS